MSQVADAFCLFELGRELAQLHARSDAGRITVVPVLVSNLDAARPILSALCAIEGGRFFDAVAPELGAPVPASADAVRMTALTTALDTAPYGGARSVRLDPDPSGMVDATFDPPAGAAASGGERTVLAFARAIAHSQLDEHELAVIAYEDFPIDHLFRRAIWSLIVDQLPDLPHRTLRTLVIVAETEVDVPLHCQTGRGFRLAVDGDRLLRRNGRDDLNAAAGQVARHPRPYVLFLGAGFSVSSRLPLGNDLRDSAIRRLLGIDDLTIESHELAKRFHEWIATKAGWMTASEALMRGDDYVARLTLEQVIRAESRIYGDLPTLAEFRTRHDSILASPGSAVIDLAYVLEQSVGRAMVVEVNFDTLVETHTTVPVRTFASESDFEGAGDYISAYLSGSETAIPLLKLHGTITEPGTCVVSDEQTELGVGSGKLEALRRLFDNPERLWVYVGASMRDRDLVPVLGSEDFARHIDERWVAPYLADTVEDFARSRLPFWRQGRLPALQDRVITETADAFFAAMRVALTP